MSKVFTHTGGRGIAKLIIAACLILACIALTRQVQAAFLDYQVKTMTAQMKDLKMKTMCVGRFLIDIPVDAEVSYRGAMIAGWSISTYDNETDEQFASRIEKKEAQLSDAKNERGKPSLEATHQVDKNGVHGKIYIFDRKWVPHMPAGMPAENVRMEATIRMQNHSFDLALISVDENDLKELTELVTQFRSREEHEIPAEAGYCFDGGFITEPIKVEQTERTTMFVGLNGHPDVSIALDMTAGITTPKTLLQRDADASIGNENSSRFHILRRGPRAFNSAPGEEVLERAHEFNGNYTHSFMWEPIHNKTDNVFTPLMSFELSTGHGRPGTTVDSSLTDAEALALWDKMLSSLRVRPVERPKPVAVPPAPAPLGTQANSGMPCPASGWWRCVDALALDGTRWFEQGQILPTVTLQQQQSLMARLKGTSDVTVQPAVWELVRHEKGAEDSPQKPT